MHLAIASLSGKFGLKAFFLDEPSEVIIKWFFVSLQTLEVFYGVRVESPEALEVLPVAFS
jgi:hypothetical protein